MVLKNNIYSMNIKYIILIIIIIIETFFLFKGNKHNPIDNTILISKINHLKNDKDSLNKLSKILEYEYDSIKTASYIDSIKIDSLNKEISIVYDNIETAEKKANFYITKYKNEINKIKYLETHMVYKDGDSLLYSLSKKIN